MRIDAFRRQRFFEPTPYIERIDNAPVPSMAEVGAGMKDAAHALTSLMGFNLYWQGMPRESP
ncbi:hypothetical protein QYH69_02735 [Paraburkholderia sp. SARCC-3016]|jgi:hypothetical protein|uniref:hypothetical protein n=1 Tax=Paraburkholderia sp. SARCC-3016 TaxID=3058611 RepID=UPI0028092413|nr:hypothetical protein [Paraburkholderia sp. SARCC-3016]MDQ7976160.1 hypothetical protein [Paraburkholderia sp. SARCC-3016]